MFWSAEQKHIQLKRRTVTIGKKNNTSKPFTYFIGIGRNSRTSEVNVRNERGGFMLLLTR